MLAQGCGKTTLVDILERLFTHVGIRAASVSIDDFYLTFADQQQLAKVTPSLHSLKATHFQRLPRRVSAFP